MSNTNNIRIIPRIDIKGPNLVKGIHLEGLRVLGKPEDFANYYYQQGADELMYMDTVASLYERNSLDHIISSTAKQIFIPLTVGGGIRSIDDIRRVLRAGADKVSINTAAIQNPEFIKNASREFGSSTIVVAIETIKEPNGTYLAYTDNGREHTGVEAIAWAEQAQDLGAGELVITSVDQEGTGEGFDINFLKTISEKVSIPVIAHGGAGSKENVLDVIHGTSIDGVAIASILHYDYATKASNRDHHEEEGNVEFLSNIRGFKNLSTVSIPALKNWLGSHQVNCRPFIEPVKA